MHLCLQEAFRFFKLENLPTSLERARAFEERMAHEDLGALREHLSAQGFSLEVQLQAGIMEEAPTKLALAPWASPLDPPPPQTETQARLRDCLEEALRFYQHNLISAGSQASVLGYLERRQITPETSKTFEIGWAREGWTALRDHLTKKGFSLTEQVQAGLVKEGGKSGHYDFYRDRLILPLRDQWGQLTGFAGRILSENVPKYLNPPATELYDKSSQLYGLNHAAPTINYHMRALVVEGYLDVTRLHEHGFKQAVAACGTAFGQGQLETLAWAGAAEVDLLFDGDQAGQTAALKAACLLLENGFEGRTLILPKGTDPDELLQTHGPQALEEIYRQAPDHPRFIAAATWAQVKDQGLSAQSQAVEELLDFAEKLSDQHQRDLVEQLAHFSGMEQLINRLPAPEWEEPNLDLPPAWAREESPLPKQWPPDQQAEDSLEGFQSAPLEELPPWASEETPLPEELPPGLQMDQEPVLLEPRGLPEDFDHSLQLAHYFAKVDPFDQLEDFDLFDKEKALTQFTKDLSNSQTLSHPGNQWFGKGADKLGLKSSALQAQLFSTKGKDAEELKNQINELAKEEYRFLHMAYAPEGTPADVIGRPPHQAEANSGLNRLLPDAAYKTRQTQGKDGQTHTSSSRRPGEDVPFSPPKSISILALHCGDKRLTDLHFRSIKTVLKYYERNLTVYRHTHNKHTTWRRSDNLVTMLRTHATSRDLDPQLHTHTILMNLTQTPDGWRSRVNDTTFRFLGFLNSFYQSEMAKGAQELGYQIEHLEKGKWEIAGVPEAALDIFSKRTEDVDNVLDELRPRYPWASLRELRKIATLYTRKEKDANPPTLKELRDKWEAQYSRTQILEGALKAKEAKSDRRHLSPTELVSLVARHISESESTFTHEELLAQAMGLSRGRYVAADLQKAVEQLTERGELLERPRAEVHEVPEFNLLTTREIYELERQTLSQIKKGVGAVRPLARFEEVERALVEGGLSPGQKDAVRMMLLSPNRYGLIQGDAGTGKTTAVAKLKQILEDKKTFVPIRGLGFTGRAAAELEESGKVPTSTIDSFLKIPLSKLPRRALMVVDEASMVSSRHLAALVERAEATDSRMVFVGDGKQLSAIGAGRMFLDLQEAQATSQVKMSEVFRQQSPHLIAAVAGFKAFVEGRDRGGVHRAFGELRRNKGLVSWMSHNLLPKMADDYVERFAKESVLAVTAKNEDRGALNQMIRKRLVEKGEIEAEAHLRSVLFPVPLRAAERFDAQAYRLNDVVVLSSPLGPLEAGREHKITKLNPLSRSIEIEGVEISLLEHQSKMSVYRAETLDFAIGDLVVFLKNDRALQVQNGMTGRIKALDETNLKVEVAGELLTIPTEEYRYLDHGYASTIHKSQGRTCDAVLIYADSSDRQLNSAESFYTSLTRARFEAVVYTENAKLLAEQVGLSQAKTSSLEFPEFDLPQPAPRPVFEASELQIDSLGSPPAVQEVLLQALRLGKSPILDKRVLFANARSLVSAQQIEPSQLDGVYLTLALETLKAQNHLLEFKAESGSQLVGTETYLGEREVAARIKKGLGQCLPLLADQEGPASELLSSKNRFIFLESLGGRLHRSWLKEAGQLLTKESPFRPQELAVLAKSRAARSALEEQTGLRSYSSFGLLAGTERPPQGCVLVVEAAQRLSLHEWQALTAQAEEQNLRLLLVGDRADELGPGGLFGALAEQHPSEVLRLGGLATAQDQPLVQHLTNFLKGTDQGGVRRGFRGLSEAGCLHANSDLSQLVQNLGRSQALAFSPEEQAGINQAVQAARQEAGTLGPLQGVPQLRPLRLGPEQLLNPQSYQPSDLVRIQKGFGPFTEGATYQVTGHQGEDLLLDGIPVRIKDHFDRLQFFREQEIQLGEGDRLVFNRAESSLGLQGGEQGKLQAFGEGEALGKLKVQLDDGRELWMDPKLYGHLDLAYCLLPYQLPAQVEELHLWAPSDRHLTAAGLLEVASRAAQVHLYTDEAVRLVERLERPATKDTSLSLPEREVSAPSPKPLPPFPQAPLPKVELLKVIKAALEQMGGRESLGSRRDLLRQMERFGIEPPGQGAIESALAAMVEVGFLVDHGGAGDLEQKSLCLGETYREEHELLQIFTQGQGDGLPLMAQSEAAYYLDPHQPVCAKAALDVLTHPDQLQLLVSRGQEHTHQLLRQAAFALNRGTALFRPKNLVALTWSAKEASEVSEACGIKTQVFGSFLASHDLDQWRGVTLAVTGAERLDSAILHAIAQHAQDLRANLLLIGSDLNPEPFGPGRGFLDLVEQGQAMRLVHPEADPQAQSLANYIEGKDPQGMREVLLSLHRQGRFVGLEDPGQLAQRIAQEVVSLGGKAQVASKLFQDRLALTESIREALSEAGLLKGERLLPVWEGLRPERPFEAKSYEPGDLVQVRTAFGEFHPGQELNVSKRESPHPNRIWIGGQEVDLFEAVGKLSFSRMVERPFAIGERVQLLKKDDNSSLFSGQVGQLVGFGPEGEVQLVPEGESKPVTLPPQFPHLARAWVLAPHRVQGPDRVLLHAPAQARLTAKDLYGLWERSAGDLQIYADQLAQVTENFEQRQDNTSSLDLKLARVPHLDEPGLRQLLDLPEPRPRPLNFDPELVPLLEQAVSLTAATESAFTKHQLFRTTRGLKGSPLEERQLENALSVLKTRGVLLDFGGDPKQANLTTPELYQLERQTLARVEAGRGVCEPLVSPQAADRWMDQAKLAGSRREAASLMLLSKDLYSFIEAEAGADRREAFSKTAELLKRRFFLARLFNPKEIEALTLSGDAALQTAQETGLKASTIAGFLARDLGRLPKGAVYLVDEATLLDSRTMEALTKRIEATQSRAVFVGDGHRLQAVGAGRPFADLLSHSGAERVTLCALEGQIPANLTRWRRQVEAFALGGNPDGIRQAFRDLDQEGKIKTDLIPEALLARLARDWVDSPARPLVLTPNAEDRELLTEAIRQELSSRGKLGPAVALTFQKPLRPPGLERFNTQAYQLGDLVQIHQPFGDFKAHETLKVEALRPETNKLVAGGKEINLLRDLGKVNFWRAEVIELATGDRVRFMASDRDLGVRSGASGELLTLNPKKAVIRLDDGRKIRFNPEKCPHLEPAYVGSPYQQAGAEADQVLLYLSSKQGPANRSSLLTTALASARQDFHLYSDHLDLVTEQLELSRGKASTLNLATSPEPAHPGFGAEGPAEALGMEREDLAKPRAARVRGVGGISGLVFPDSLPHEQAEEQAYLRPDQEQAGLGVEDVGLFEAPTSLLDSNLDTTHLENREADLVPEGIETGLQMPDVGPLEEQPIQQDPAQNIAHPEEKAADLENLALEKDDQEQGALGKEGLDQETLEQGGQGKDALGATDQENENFEKDRGVLGKEGLETDALEVEEQDALGIEGKDQGFLAKEGLEQDALGRDDLEDSPDQEPQPLADLFTVDQSLKDLFAYQPESPTPGLGQEPDLSEDQDFGLGE